MSVERGNLLFNSGRFDLADREYRQALVADPNDALAHAMLGLCLVRTKQYKPATDEARIAVDLRPDWHVGYSVLAQVLLERERPKEAIGPAGRALELNPFDPGLHGLMARVRLALRQWQLALTAADAGLAIDPENGVCINARGIALVQLGRREEAGVTMAGALGKNPEDAVTHANQGYALLHAGDYKASMVHFREALRLDPELAWAKSGIVEAMKARNVVYRVMLRYFLFMSRMSGRVQWGIVIGGYLAVQLVRKTGEAHPDFLPYAYVVVAIYTVFAIGTWLASPLFNLMLRLDRFGRYVLSDDQKWAANIVGLLLGGGIVLGLIGLIRGSVGLVIAGLLTAVLSVSASAIFRCQRGWPRWAMTGYTLALAGVAAYAVAKVFDPAADGSQVQYAINLFVIGEIASGFVANALGSMTVRR